MYYILYGFLYLVSLLPFFILYRLSDMACFILYYVIRYRRGVVSDNLLIAFPEKTQKERNKIAWKFYLGLTDTFIELIKLLSISEKEFDRRSFIDLEKVKELIAKGYNIQFEGGHQMNWEYANWAAAKRLSIPFVGVYMRIENKALEKIIYDLRKKYGTVLVPATAFNTRVHHVFNEQYSIGLIADQSPGSPKYGYWLNFFNKPTSFTAGPEKGAKRGKTAAVFVRLYKVKRGHYRFEPMEFIADAGSLESGELTIRYRNFLENTIRLQPENYLWSHRKWKSEYIDEYQERWIDPLPAPTVK